MSIVKKQTAFLRRWNELQRSSATLSYEQAKLLDEVRRCFPRSKLGTSQFRTWCLQKLLDQDRGNGSRLRHLVTVLNCYRAFTRADWRAVELRGLIWALNVDVRARRRLMTAVRQKSKELERPISLSCLINLAADLGIKRKSGRLVRGDERLQVLRRFIARLYREYDALPPLPRDVAAVMGAKGLDELAAQFKRRA